MKGRNKKTKFITHHLTRCREQLHAWDSISHEKSLLCDLRKLTSKSTKDSSYTMMAKPIRVLELHYPTIQFLIMINMYLMNSRTSKICLNMKYLPTDYSISSLHASLLYLNSVQFWQIKQYAYQRISSKEDQCLQQHKTL